ncbi:uncharacterized protein PAC_02958 [Phialocephala subalpina]|uniref:DUF7605 domain-containing protein n=1 Tax=Phialocephala subalpina TaxID=576137 RepID=A0A1L7WJY8_9HELO|nr:uncharacterized protein PAC_02958 [Phialocephala subalpina]
MDRSSLPGLSQAYAATINGKAQAGVKKPRAKATKPRAKPAKPAKPAKTTAKPAKPAKSTKASRVAEQIKSAIKVEDSDDEPVLFVDPEEPSKSTKRLPTPPPEEPLTDADITLSLNSEKDEEARVLRKERCAELGLASVKQLKSLFEEHAGSYNGAANRVAECDEILQLGEIPRILVGVLGYTGSGKSSLINALHIRCCGDRRNISDDPSEAFKAEVEFVTAEDWDDEFEILANDIKNSPTAELGTEASLGLAKLSAVYPGIPINRIVESTPTGLELERDLSHVLGQSITIKESTASKFSEAINAYIDSSNKGTGADEFAYWPLVRLVKVYIKSDLLKNGLVLVDLPGLGDSNLGRSQVAEKYIQNLRHMWVVADIVRAIDDKVANELMSRSFKRQLLMDGRYHENFVTFVMTKTDQLTTDEVIKSLHLDQSVLKNETAEWTRLSDELTELKEQLGRLKRNRKRKLAEVELESETLNATLTSKDDLNGKISTIKKSIASLNVRMKTVCIQERNTYTQGHLSRDFKRGRGELLDELDIKSPELEGSKTSLNSFCVSAKAYQKLSGRFKRDNSIKGFPNVNDTNIPSLQAFALQCTLADREYAADKILGEISFFELNLKSWAENRGETPQLSNEQRQLLIQEVEKYYLAVKKVMVFNNVPTVTERAKENVVQNIRRTVKVHITGNTGKFAVKATDDALKLSTNLADKDISWATWRAICNRNGDKYSTGKKVEYHWNVEFHAPFEEPLSKPWNHTFNVRLPAQHSAFARALVEAFRGFQTSFHSSVNRICGKYNLGSNILQRKPLFEEDIRRKVDEALKAGQKHSQTAHRTVAGTVKGHMLAYYTAAKKDTGKGVGLRMKKNLVKFVKNNGGEMFKNTSTVLETELEKMLKVFRKELTKAANTTQGRLKREILGMIKVAGLSETSQSSTASVELRRLVLKELVAMDETWAKELVDPSVDLRARNPFANVVNTEEDEKYLDGDGKPDAEVSDGDDDSASESSSEEDNDDSDDGDYSH